MPNMPNILFIVSDDQRWDTVGLEHSLDGITRVMPRVSRLADSGVTFPSAFIQSPVCAASRSSILTGQYAHNHGVLTNQLPYGVRAFNDAETLAVWLQRVGYRTGLFGKYINGYSLAQVPQTPPGWDEWCPFDVRPSYYDYDLVEGGALHHYGSNATDYSTYVLAQKASDFIAGSQPFFAMFTPYSPHQPATAALRHQGAFDGLASYLPPNFNEADVSDKPKWVRDLAPLNTAQIQQAQDLRRSQLAANLALDDVVGSFVDQLQVSGRLDDTCIVYLSDNGFAWGEHRHVTKYAAYEESIRAALIIRYPPLTGPGGWNVTAMASNLDIAPTLCELAGASMVLSPMNGISLVPVIGGAPSRADLLLEHTLAETLPRQDPPDYSGVRTADGFKLVSYVDQAQGDELYDLSADQYELVNQASNPAYGNQKAALLARLNELKAE